jgi:hypothetical protein
MVIVGEELIFVTGFCGQYMTDSVIENLFLSDESLSHLSMCTDAQNNRYWSIINVRDY